jgi:hypothetical protein
MGGSHNIKSKLISWEDALTERCRVISWLCVEGETVQDFLRKMRDEGLTVDIAVGKNPNFGPYGLK